MNNIGWMDDYEAIQHGAGACTLPHWSCLELRGKDRRSLLNALATNRLNDLAPGQGRETFLTDVKGHVVAHGVLMEAEDSALFVTAASRADTIAAHIDRYVVREDVQVADRSVQTEIWHIGGQQADRFLQEVGISAPDEPYRHAAGAIEGVPVRICRVEMTGPVGFLLLIAPDQVRVIDRVFQQAGVKVCAQQAFEAARIQWGWPLDGVDVTSGNFPQEVGRDDLAISFTKGCYLGQETVARIDSRGHVNKKLSVVRFPEAKDAAPTTLFADGKPIGETTSIAYSPESDCHIALAYVRREWAEPGTRIDSRLGPAEVVVPGWLSCSNE